MKTIAILLTVHNRKIKTLHCLANVFSQHPVLGYEWEVYLTNDGCTDGTPEAVKKEFPSVNITHGDGNLYWNRGMYKAWQMAASIKEYDYFLWLNDDTILNPDALQTLLYTSEQLKNLAIVVGSTAAMTSDTVTYGGRSDSGQLIIPSKQPMPCAYFNGNIVLIPQSVYRIVGVNDPVFHHALGDFDYGLRAKKLGVELYIAPGILGRCDIHPSLPVWCNPQKSLVRRWRFFRTPLGQNPEEFFVFENRHSGILKAVFHYLTNHLRVLYPRLWI
jgi:GT2 family glycosyltransferase